MRRAWGSVSGSDGSWLVQWTDNGKRRSKRVRGTRADAERFLGSVALSSCALDVDITWGSYWETAVEPSLSSLAPRTQAEYRRTWGRVEPHIGGMRMRETTTRRIQDCVSAMPNPSEQKRAKVLLRKMARMAIELDGLAMANPVTKRVMVDSPATTETPVWDAETLSKALERIGGTKYAPLVLCAVGAGLRPEEAYALRWSDIAYDGAHAWLSISRTSTIIDGAPTVRDATKTKLSTRTACLGEPFASMLERYRGESWLCGAGARPTSPSTIARNWKLWCERNDVPHVTFEGMRHTYKTLCAEACVPAEIVRMQMGHAGAGVAERHYLERTRGLLAVCADMLSHQIASAADNRTRSDGVSERTSNPSVAGSSPAGRASISAGQPR